MSVLILILVLGANYHVCEPGYVDCEHHGYLEMTKARLD